MQQSAKVYRDRGPPAPDARLFRVGPEPVKTSPTATAARLRVLTEPARKSRTSGTYRGQGTSGSAVTLKRQAYLAGRTAAKE